MGQLPVSLKIAMRLVATMWIVGLTAYYFEFSRDLVWLVLFMGTVAALMEWRAARNREDL